MARHPDTWCTNIKHQDGGHDASCLPPADPQDPELRLIRAIFGLCGICDQEMPHEHSDTEYLDAIMIPPAIKNEEGLPMPDTNLEHAESWTVTVVPAAGEPPWPLVTAPDGMSLEPDLILVWLQTGRDPVVRGSGRRVRRDATVGSLRVNAPWAVLDDLPDWARKLADEALAEYGMLPGTGRHVIVPLPGSVRDQTGPIGEPVTSNHMLWHARYPLTALCSQCQEPVTRSSPDSPWEHQS